MIFSQQTRSPQHHDQLAVAIKGVRPNQRHVGIVYMPDNQTTPRICHLAWHYKLQDELLPTEYHWAPSGMDEYNKPVAVAYVATLSQNAQSIPYGLDYTLPYFDDNGRYNPQPLGKGLTCAPFILAVFASLGFTLLKRDEWPSRSDDITWQ